MSKEQIIASFKEFLDRKKKVGFDVGDIYLMAFSYLDALCECGLLLYSEHSELMRYVEV